MRRFTLAALALLAAGCTSTNISELAKALAADPNTACIKQSIGTPYGTVTTTIYRTGASAAKLQCNDSGMTFDSTK